MTDDPRPLDLVLFGATGFVGRLTAEYLARAAPPEVRIALAGRSRERLEEVRAGLGPRAADWAIRVADSSQPASVDALARTTRVLATTVGPYRRYGLPVVEACARAGTHYADLTGEVLFMHEAIERFDGPARESGRGSSTPAASTRSPRTWGSCSSTRPRRPTAPEPSRTSRSSSGASRAGRAAARSTRCGASSTRRAPTAARGGSSPTRTP
jgi:hypothetical protein